MSSVEQENRKRRLDRRTRSSLFMFFSFLWLVPSGIAMHLFDGASTRVAYHVAMSMHWAAAVVFLTAVVIHLVVNWKSVRNLLAQKAREYFAFNREAVVALVVVTAIVLLVASHAVLLG